jgi:hypothetical protein
MQMIKKIKHDHWRKLIDHPKLKKIADEHENYLILTKPLSPPLKRKGKTYDYLAYIHGAGSDYLGKFIHQDTCVWEEA